MYNFFCVVIAILFLGVSCTALIAGPPIVFGELADSKCSAQQRIDRDKFVSKCRVYRPSSDCWREGTVAFCVRGEKWGD